MMVNVEDGFGGLGSALLEQLADEYGNKSYLTFGLAKSQIAHSSTPVRIY